MTTALRIGGWRWLLWGGIAAVLLTPLIAMQFTDEVRWTAFDFAVAGGLLVGGAGFYELAVRLVRRPHLRALIAAALALAVLVIWAQGAVGIF